MRPWRSLSRWYEDHRVGVLDLLALMLACVLTGGLIFSAGLAEPAWLFVRQHAAWRLESVLLCLALTWGFLALFAWRRWRDVTRLLEAAETDALTGLENRRKTLRVLAHEFERAVRYGRPLAVVMFDIDHFKHVNDTFGHPAGDQVLKAVSRRITRKMRATDHFGRWGGEEFLLICPETDEVGASRIAERMRRSIKRRSVGPAGYVTASFGVCAYRGERDYESLVEKADQYLYMAKQGGRDRVMGRYAVIRTAAQAEAPVDSDEVRTQLLERRA